jgi:hypothetical protein
MLTRLRQAITVTSLPIPCLTAFLYRLTGAASPLATIAGPAFLPIFFLNPPEVEKKDTQPQTLTKLITGARNRVLDCYKRLGCGIAILKNAKEN